MPSPQRVPGTDMHMLPRDLQEEEDDGDYGAPDPNDDADFEDQALPGPALGETQDILSEFIKQLENLSSMAGPDISAIVSDLPVPQEGDVEMLSVHEAVEV